MVRAVTFGRSVSHEGTGIVSRWITSVGIVLAVFLLLGLGTDLRTGMGACAGGPLG